MQSIMKAFIAFAILSNVASAGGITPIGKVIQMLTDMKSKGEKEMAVESKVMTDYSKSVRMQTRELDHEIKTSKASIEKLIAKIEKAVADVAAKKKAIAINDAEQATLEADQKASTEARAAAKDKFLAEQTDYGESLYALDKAIEMLKSKGDDKPQAMMLLQGMTKTVSGMRRVLASLALAQTRTEGGGAPAVAAYESQTGSIIEMLEGLKDNFRKELGELEKEEANSAHAFDMEMVHLTSTLENLKADTEESSEVKARSAAEAATAKGDLADTKSSLADAEKFLSDMKSTHAVKSSTFEANQKVRQDELEAIGKAIEIMSGDNVSGSYGKHVNAQLVQEPKKVALGFLQLHSSSRQALRTDAVMFLKTQAKALKSKTLAAFAAKLTASNPFDKVVTMIEDLLEKLKEAAASEADHKAYCDKELKKNKLKREKKTAEVEGLQAEIEEKTAQIQDMANKISTLAEEQAALREEVAEATKTRGEEKAANEVAIKDAAEAQVAVSSALAVLKEFYASQSSFVQQAPEMEEYKGMQAGAGGVVGMMEVIQSDFARLETDTKAAEAQAVAEYKAFMTESEDTLKAKHDSEFKTGLAKDTAEFDKEQLEKNLGASSKQLDLANSYYGELKPQCVEVHVSFEERAQMRQDEIKALQEAYKILNQKS